MYMYVFIFLAPLAEVIRVKSLYHLMLEKRLEENKNRVLQLEKEVERNSSEIVRLREVAINMTKALTAEIKREMKLGANDRKELWSAFTYYQMYLITLFYIRRYAADDSNSSK